MVANWAICKNLTKGKGMNNKYWALSKNMPSILIINLRTEPKQHFLIKDIKHFLHNYQAI